MPEEADRQLVNRLTEMTRTNRTRWTRRTNADPRSPIAAERRTHSFVLDAHAELPTLTATDEATKATTQIAGHRILASLISQAAAQISRRARSQAPAAASVGIHLTPDPADPGRDRSEDLARGLAEATRSGAVTWRLLPLTVSDHHELHGLESATHAFRLFQVAGAHRRRHLIVCPLSYPPEGGAEESTTAQLTAPGALDDLGEAITAQLPVPPQPLTPVDLALRSLDD